MIVLKCPVAHRLRIVKQYEPGLFSFKEQSENASLVSSTTSLLGFYIPLHMSSPIPISLLVNFHDFEEYVRPDGVLWID